MKIVNIIGGLGNQMFQYAFLLALQKHTGDICLMDTSKYVTYGLHNGFELDRVFNISSRVATKEELKKVTRYTTNYKLSRIYRKLLPNKKTEVIEPMPRCTYLENIFDDAVGDKYYEGIWQNERYFADVKPEILSEFTFKHKPSERNELLCKKFENSVSVSIHIRRGDYLNHKNYKGLCGLDYYTKAIEYVKNKYGNNACFAIFSNDMEWCDANIKPLVMNHETIFVDWNKGDESYNDIRLMSCCKVNIIANSSFSWWAAYLNKHSDNEVIAPAVWTNMPVEFSRQLSSWTLF